MKKIIAFLLSVIIAYTPTLIFAADKDDIDFQNRYQTGNWKHDKVTPYNTAGSTQPDYYNSSKYNVSSSRDVTSNGSKYKQTTNVAVEVSKAEKAATIANRAKNMAEYAKKLGKASLPAFLGSAALTGLLNGIGWVMDEGGKITKKEDVGVNDEMTENTDGKYTSDKRYYFKFSSGNVYAYSVENACKLYVSKINTVQTERRYVFGKLNGSSSCYVHAYATNEGGGNTFNISISPTSEKNPHKNTDPVSVEVTPDQFADAVKKALEENNAAQAEAIAQAIKDAFSESDLDKNPNTGEKNNPIADKTKKALDEKGAAELKEDADPTVCVPRPGDLEGQCTNMPKSEADQIPTLECVNNPIVSANSCVYQVDPNAPTKPGTIEKPGVNPETGELPEACVWFDVHCKWLEWTQEEPDQDNTDTEVEEKDRDFDFDIFKKDRFTVSRQCPAPVEHTIELSGISTSFSFDLKPLCDVLEMARPALVGCSYLYAAYIVIGAARNG